MVATLDASVFAVVATTVAVVVVAIPMLFVCGF